MLCPKCGNEVADNKKFCKSCGYKFPTQLEILLNRLKRNWKKLLFVFLFIVFVCTIAPQLLYYIIGKIQFNHAINNRYNGHIIVVQNQNGKSFNDDMVQDINLKLKYAFGDQVYIKQYFKDKAVIYTSENVSQNSLDSYLSKSALEFKKQGIASGEWINTGVNGKDIKKALVSTNSQGEWTVSLEFTKDGAEKFAKLTKEITGQQLAIFLSGELVSAPTISESITGGYAMISGGDSGFTYEEARNFVDILDNALNLKIVDVKK